MKETAKVRPEEAAVTIFSSIVIPRVRPKEDVSQIDLENYLSQAIWKFFDRHRKGAAKRLKVGELDLILNDVQVVGLKVDGHRLLNPEGFTGKEIEIILGGTFLERKNPPQLNRIFEEGVLQAYLLAKDKGLPHLLYIDVGEDLVKIFLSTPSYTSYVDEFAWGKRHLTEAITSAWQVPEDVAYSIYLKYVWGETSPRLAKMMETIFNSVFANFKKGIGTCLLHFKEAEVSGNHPIYLKSFPLPESIYKHRLEFGRNKAKIFPADELEVESLLKDYIYDAYANLNLLAKRRLKWLIRAAA